MTLDGRAIWVMRLDFNPHRLRDIRDGTQIFTLDPDGDPVEPRGIVFDGRATWMVNSAGDTIRQHTLKDI
jgi:hypothetical protein